MVTLYTGYQINQGLSRRQGILILSRICGGKCRDRGLGLMHFSSQKLAVLHAGANWGNFLTKPGCARALVPHFRMT